MRCPSRLVLRRRLVTTSPAGRCVTASRSAWTARAAASTTSLSSGCGAASYEEVHRHAHTSVADARAGIGAVGDVAAGRDAVPHRHEETRFLFGPPRSPDNTAPCGAAPRESPPVAQGTLHRVARSAHPAPREITPPPVTEHPRLSEGEQSDLDRDATNPVYAVEHDIPDATHWRQRVNEIAELPLFCPRQPGEPRAPIGRP